MNDNGCDGEIERLVKEQSGALTGFAMRFLHDLAGAHDAVQETFIKYVRFRQGPPPKKVEHPPAWLFRTARNACFDMLRAGNRKFETGIKDSEMEKFHDEKGVPPDRKAILRDDLRTMARCFNELGEREREALILKLEHGKSYAEIASILDISVSNTGVLLHGALKKLKTAFRQAEGGSL